MSCLSSHPCASLHSPSVITSITSRACASRLSPAFASCLQLVLVSAARRRVLPGYLCSVVTCLTSRACASRLSSSLFSCLTSPACSLHLFYSFSSCLSLVRMCFPPLSSSSSPPATLFPSCCFSHLVRVLPSPPLDSTCFYHSSPCASGLSIPSSRASRCVRVPHASPITSLLVGRSSICASRLSLLRRQLVPPFPRHFVPLVCCMCLTPLLCLHLVSTARPLLFPASLSSFFTSCLNSVVVYVTHIPSPPVCVPPQSHPCRRLPSGPKLLCTLTRTVARFWRRVKGHCLLA